DGGRNDGIHIASYYYTNAPIDITLDFDDIVIDTIGDGGAGDRGIEIYFDSYYSQPFGLTGRMDNITVSNTSGDNILIQNITAGIVDPILSGLTLTNPLNDRYGLYIIGAGDGNTRPTIDDSFDPGVATNLIGDATAGSGGRWGLLISGADGTYSDITISNTTQASMYFSGNSSPTFGNNITLVDSPSPYTLAGMSLPAGISYTEGAGLSNLYVNTYGTFTNDATLSADPLGTGTSVWYVDNDITINAGATLTIDAGAVLKAVDNVDIFVDGTLDVDPINAGGNVVITDFRDDNYNGDSNNNGVSTGSNTANWQGIDFRIGSLGTVNNLIVEFAEVGVHVQDAGDTGGLNFTNLEINNSVDGLYVYQTSTTISTAPTFDGLSINECSSEHIYLRATNTTTGALMQPIFSGDLSITDVIGSYAPNGIYNIYVGSYVVLSGFTITGTQEAVDLHTGTSLTLENNIIRQATNMGINARSAAAPVIQNNIIVNNGITGANDSGIYANTGTNAFINNNIIRQNRGDYGAGIMVRASSPVIQNNLIIENEDIQNDIYGGSGIFVWDNSAPSILNNTIANNISATTTQGGGIHIDSSSSGQVTMLDNIIYGNLDGNSTAKDVYLNGSVTLVESNNLIGVHNLATPDATDIIAVDPQFTDGWYLANQNVFPLGPIDAGSVLAGETALGNGVVIMSATTTRTDGVNEGAASMIDMGYHYPDTTAAPTISAANTTVTPASHIETPNTGGTVVTITLTPKDSGDFDLGAGLDVSVAVGALEADFLSSVKDLGDGTYQVTYTIPVGSSSANVSFNVNGVDITATTDISWTL
ncbi:MAG: right-handed parallel beta-helix repeat-containing protein, partial [Gammaproteobacteria bacterium]|nr:right-handed parallel beta-helix repeat-containing protein [Gammaproteobacteria bacterium]MBT6458065.1 right-handed parallel beta-helix repeat-containing protein [Gammaproteobacteria bacterium]